MQRPLASSKIETGDCHRRNGRRSRRQLKPYGILDYSNVNDLWNNPSLPLATLLKECPGAYPDCVFSGFILIEILDLHDMSQLCRACEVWLCESGARCPSDLDFFWQPPFLILKPPESYVYNIVFGYHCARLGPPWMRTQLRRGALLKQQLPRAQPFLILLNAKFKTAVGTS